MLSAKVIEVCPVDEMAIMPESFGIDPGYHCFAVVPNVLKAMETKSVNLGFTI